MTTSHFTTTATLTPGVTYSFKVTARNTVGSSDYSSIISTLAAQIPDAPTQLANNAVITSAYQIGLSWSAPDFNGCSAIIDYSIWYDNGTGLAFTELLSGLKTLSYTALSLTPGNTYQFKVEARNIYGFSAFSSAVSILAA